jgi:hypothetical protein
LETSATTLLGFLQTSSWPRKTALNSAPELMTERERPHTRERSYCNYLQANRVYGSHSAVPINPTQQTKARPEICSGTVTLLKISTLLKFTGETFCLNLSRGPLKEENVLRLHALLALFQEEGLFDLSTKISCCLLGFDLVETASSLRAISSVIVCEDHCYLKCCSLTQVHLNPKFFLFEVLFLYP